MRVANSNESIARKRSESATGDNQKGDAMERLAKEMIEALDDVVREHGDGLTAEEIKTAIKQFVKEWTI